jgi:D-sedoheptulose 7-phosphate isomerase
MSGYASRHLAEAAETLRLLDLDAIESLAERLARLRLDNGRLFVIGVGGSAANASHAVNDFRKLAGIETYSPADNVSELTARTNDEGWDTVFSAWLQISNLNPRDLLMVLSVGGGDSEKSISPNIVKAVDQAEELGVDVSGIVGRDGGHTGRKAKHLVLVPTVSEANVTPHAESTQSVVLHLLVSHPLVKLNQTKW